jgi:hypothetical protein
VTDPCNKTTTEMRYTDEDRRIVNVMRPAVGQYTLHALAAAKEAYDALRAAGYRIVKDAP